MAMKLIIQSTLAVLLTMGAGAMAWGPPGTPSKAPLR